MSLRRSYENMQWHVDLRLPSAVSVSACPLRGAMWLLSFPGPGLQPLVEPVGPHSLPMHFQSWFCWWQPKLLTGHLPIGDPMNRTTGLHVPCLLVEEVGIEAWICSIDGSKTREEHSQ